jgi:predicted amidohydrolase
MSRNAIYLLVATMLLYGSSCSNESPPAAEEPVAATMPQLVRADGTYPVQPLEKDVVVVKVVQHITENIQDAETPEAGLEENLSRMQYWIDKACTEGKKPDFILFNEFPLTGYSSGPREEKLKFTIEVPGPETARVGEMAKACDTYIIFGSYARDPDWPGHILSLNPVINREGEVAYTYWKTRNASRYDPSGEIPTTTIENVRDKFRARYGIEAEFPVLQTEFGNIAVSTVQLDPLVFAAFAMRGTEIMFRTATGFSPTDVRAIAYYNNFYSAMSNMAVDPALSYADQFGGKSLIVAPGGRVLAQEPGNVEAVIEAEIPIAEFRKGRLLPRYPMEMVWEVFSQFQQELPANHLDLPPEELPKTRQEMKDLLDEVSRWLN